MRFVDVECGIGGFGLAVRKAGHTLLFATDHDNAFLEVFQSNIPIPTKQVLDIKAIDIPHPDVIVGSLRDIEGVKSAATLIAMIMPRFLVFEVAKRVDPSIIWSLGYIPRIEKMNAKDYALPQERSREFAVAYRKEIKPNFMVFPFPDALRTKSVLKDVLDSNPDPSLDITQSILETAAKRNEDRAKRKLGFKTRVISGEELCPALLPRYGRDRTDYFIEGPRGPRQLSLAEAKKIMGFPPDYVMNCKVGHAFKMLGSSTCPSVAEYLIREVVDWVF